MAALIRLKPHWGNTGVTIGSVAGRFKRALTYKNRYSERVADLRHRHAFRNSIQNCTINRSFSILESSTSDKMIYRDLSRHLCLR